MMKADIIKPIAEVRDLQNAGRPKSVGAALQLRQGLRGEINFDGEGCILRPDVVRDGCGPPVAAFLF